VECEYHRTPHRGLLNKTPIVAWLEKAHHIIHLDPAINLDEVFKHEEQRKVYNDSTIRVAGRLYEVPSHLIGKKIVIRFNPLQPENDIKISYDGKFYGEAKPVDAFANSKIKRSKNKNLLELQADTDIHLPRKYQNRSLSCFPRLKKHLPPHNSLLKRGV
jgi:putative transposase